MGEFLGSLITLLLVIAITIFLVVNLFRHLKRIPTLIAQQAWMIEDGRVNDAQEEVIDGRPRDRSRPFWAVRVTYSFSANGNPYEGSEVYSSGHFTAKARQIAEQMQGAAIKVRYNPANPQENVLYRGRILSPVIVILNIVLALVLLAAVIYMSIRIITVIQEIMTLLGNLIA